MGQRGVATLALGAGAGAGLLAAFALELESARRVLLGPA